MSPQAHKPTSPQAHKPTSPQAHKPTSLAAYRNNNPGAVAVYPHEEHCSRQLQTKLNEIIDSSFHQADLKISCIAKQLYLSTRDLNRKCNRYFQLTPKAYLTDYRLNKAVKFIFEGKAIGNIALDAGFSTHSSFGRSFKRHFGCSPSQYTEKYMRKYAQTPDSAKNE